MELSLGSYTMCSVPPSVLASSALALAMRALDTERKLSEVWNPTLQHYTQYSLAQLKPVIQQLATILVAAPNAKMATVYQKYAHKKFMKISRYDFKLFPNMMHSCFFVYKCSWNVERLP